jgi:hypothetical protein
VPVGQTTTFRSGSGLGEWVSLTDTLSGSPGISAGAAYASFEVVAWDNSSGSYSTWGQASTAWLAGLIAAGHTAEFSVSAIGGGLNAAPYLNNMQQLTSFNLYFIPEPLLSALAGLGAAMLFIFLRRR